MDLASLIPDEKQRMILEAIQKKGPTWVQHLIDYFGNHPTCRMSKATFYRHLNRLMEAGPIEMTMKEGKAYYSMKEKWRIDIIPRRIYEKKPPSGFDHYVLEEVKKLVSDMMASGLGYEAGEEPDETESALESRTEQRVRFGQRAWTLLDAITFLEERREYKLPSPEPLSYEDWLFDRWEIAGNEMEDRYTEHGIHTFSWWLSYYLNVMDELSRALSNNAGYASPVKKKKPASRP